MRLKSADAAAAPAIRPNYLPTERDKRVAANGMRLTRRIARQPALRPYDPQELAPGDDGRDDDAGLLASAAKVGNTVFHAVGTCKMGLPSDATAVADERLRFIGIDGLRIIDASVMPEITSGNTNAPTMMIPEKGAAMVLEDAR